MHKMASVNVESLYQECFLKLQKHNIELNKSYMIGDRWRDIDAGNSAGCKTIFIDYKYNESLKTLPNYYAYSLIEAIFHSLKKYGLNN